MFGSYAVSAVWSAWAAGEESDGNIGNYSTMYSAAWVYKEGCQRYNHIRDTNIFLEWAKFAHRYPMYDTSDDLITASTIIDVAKDKFDISSNQPWIDFENFKQSIGYQEH